MSKGGENRGSRKNLKLLRGTTSCLLTILSAETNTFFKYEVF